MKGISAIALLSSVLGFIICANGFSIYDDSNEDRNVDSLGILDGVFSIGLDPEIASSSNSPEHFAPHETDEDMDLMLGDEARESIDDNVVVVDEAPPPLISTNEESSTTVENITTSPRTVVTVEYTTTEEQPIDVSITSTTPIYEDTTTEEQPIDVSSTSTTPIYGDTTTEVVQTTKSNDSIENEYTETTTEISSTTLPEQENRQIALKRVNKLSDQIRLVLQQYKKTKTVKILDVPIPDPMSVPDMTNRYSVGTLNFKNMMVYGLSNFTVRHINTDLEKMQVYVMLKMERLVVKGNYTLRSWLSRAAGPFTTVLYNVTTESAAELQRNEDGELEASESDMDMTFETVDLDFKNLGLMGSVFQSAMGSVASFLFDGMKPVILGEVNTNLRSDVNKKLKSVAASLKLADMNPVDQAVMEGRRYVREQGYDPYILKNYTRDFGLLTLNVTNFKLRGLSRFYRVGEVPFSMDSGVVEAGLHVATNRLNGSCVWSVGIGNTALRNGSVHFSTEQLQIRGIVRQSLDLSEQPLLHDLDVLLGRIELKTERIDTWDYIVEAAINHLPSLLRHIIVDGLEYPMKLKVQEILNEVDVQAIVNDTLPAIDKFNV